jgi:hypothetical protein
MGHGYAYSDPTSRLPRKLTKLTMCTETVTVCSAQKRRAPAGTVFGINASNYHGVTKG